jgi:hypothetical protein
MRQHLIKLFMWGYQPHFRLNLELKAKDVLKHLGIDIEPKVLLVGVLSADSKNVNPVCIEPEDGEWPLSLFDGLHIKIDELVKNHEWQNMFFGDELSRLEKPENMFRDSVRKAIRDSLKQYDVEHSTDSFCGSAIRVEDYYVVPVIQVPKLIFQKFPPLKRPDVPERDKWRWSGPLSFLHGCIGALLSTAADVLKGPEPGRDFFGGMKRTEEIVYEGATNFMYAPGHAVNDYHHGELFARLNSLSSLMYEGTKGSGNLILVHPDNPSINYLLRFEVAISLRHPRWARKILQMATNDIALIADGEKIYGMGRLNDGYDFTKQDAFLVDFIDHYHWEIKCGNQVLLRSRYGEPKLPQELMSEQDFKSNYSRLFKTASETDCELLWSLFLAACELPYGCMIVVAEDAYDEVQRLKQQGTSIIPTLMSIELLSRVSGIDGTIILDQQGMCYAVGVILDGPAVAECTPSRGSRYNSAVRYVADASKCRMAIVVSDDHTVDIFPILHPLINRTELESNILNLEIATLDNYHKPRNWLDEHRFYLNSMQCERVNAALSRIEAMPKDVGEIHLVIGTFMPNQNLDDSYFH